uniref:Ras family protein n=1 Tax=viral metagenome TaxID=1070528 RepID=A0A6C0KDS1_9ZZZZ
MDVFRNKIVLLGSAAAGKSSLCYRFIDRNFRQTIGAAFHTKTVELKAGGLMKLDIWDTAL